MAMLSDLWRGKKAALIGGAAIVGLLTLRTSVGLALSPINPVVANTLAPDHSAAQAAMVRRMASIARSRDALPAIVATARRTLVNAPLDHATARTIAMIDLIDHRPARGNAIMTLVGHATLRDALAHAWLLNRAYASQRWHDVAREANIVMRLDPGMRTTGYAMLNQLVADGRVLPQLAEVLQERPPWRSGFLVNMGEAGRAPANERHLFDMLRHSPAPPTAEELRTWFLVNENRVSGASLQSAYQALAPYPFAPAERYIRDGAFEGSRAFAPFTWNFYQPDSGTAEVSASPEGSGHALYVEFSGYSHMIVTTQRLTLPVGRYRLSWRTYALADLPDDNVGWTLTCGAGATASALARIPIHATVGGWQNHSFALDIQPGCPGPLLSVEWQPGASARATQFYIDDVAFTPLSPRAAPAPSTR